MYAPHHTTPDQIQFRSVAALTGILLNIYRMCDIVITTIKLYHKYDVRSLVKYRYKSNNKRININL